MAAAAPSPATLAVTYQPIDALVPYARNARTHSDEQIAQIGHSMVEFGWTNPVLTDGANIIAGHGRVLAARLVWAAGKDIRNCPKGSVPCIELTGLTDTQKRALILADNRIAMNAGWDANLLQMELKELKGLGVELPNLGFASGEIAKLLARGRGVDPDKTPPLPTHAVSAPGDVWLLGKHRVLCGDATVATDVASLLGERVPHLMVTDPPYGVDYDANWRNDQLQAGNSIRGAPGGRAVGKVENDDRADWRDAWALFPGDVAYVWHAGLHSGTSASALVDTGFELRAQIIWAKHRHVISRGAYHWQHEPCWYAVREGKTANWHGDRKQTTVWEIEHQVSDTGHGTQKPVEAMQRPIENNSQAGDAIYEPFLGSGTTLIACEQTGRVCLALEINPAYVDVAVTRWQEFTGESAVLESSGETFSQIKTRRGK